MTENNNDTKAILTGEEIRIEYDEQKKIITLFLFGKNRIEISDVKESISLTDSHRNEIVMDGGGIRLNSCKDITLKAKGSMMFDASMKINGKAKSDVSLEGLNVKLQAQSSVSVKGNATAELSASGQTTVKGAMVMIN